MSKSKSPKVILVGGAGRTGTNIVKDVLCDHPDGYGLPFESRITVDPDGIAPTLALLQNAWSPFLAHVAIKRLDGFLKKAEKKACSTERQTC